MRLRGVEPPRPLRATRPSTLRVYQFRHSRSRAVDDSRPAGVTKGGVGEEIVRVGTLLATVRGPRYSPNMCSPTPANRAAAAAD
jgi:hypothetical protein